MDWVVKGEAILEEMEIAIKKIWEHLEDQQSKELFNLRFMYYVTGEASFMRKTALTVPETREVYVLLKNTQKRKLIFGAGIWGEGILRTFDDIIFECFVDNSKGKIELNEFAGKRVISFQEYLAKYSDDLVVISSRVYNQQIYQQLVENGISAKNIINVGEINDNLNKKQYFDLPQLKNCVGNDEIFVDGGSLDGRSSILFTEWCNGKFKKIYAIEPDINNKALCEKTFFENNIKNYEIVTKGLWNKKTFLGFEGTGNGVSHVAEYTGGGRYKIPVDCLDNLINEKVTFIKMDIEGSEYNALLGCKRIISEQKPKLAICVYHKPEDIIEIPELILSLNNEYRFYIRHYSTIWGETVLYAL